MFRLVSLLVTHPFKPEPIEGFRIFKIVLDSYKLESDIRE